MRQAHAERHRNFVAPDIGVGIVDFHAGNGIADDDHGAAEHEGESRGDTDPAWNAGR